MTEFAALIARSPRRRWCRSAGATRSSDAMMQSGPTSDLVRDFADQEDAVEQARVRLAVLKRPAAGSAAATGTSSCARFRGSTTPTTCSRCRRTARRPRSSATTRARTWRSYDAASQQTTRLTDFDWTPASSWAYFAAWSPDGRRIAYMQGDTRSSAPLELRVVTLAGKSSVISRNETGAMTPGGWLPDGSAIAVTARAA